MRNGDEWREIKLSELVGNEMEWGGRKLDGVDQREIKLGKEEGNEMERTGVEGNETEWS